MGSSRTAPPWRRIEELGLGLVGIAAVLYGGWFLFIAAGLGEATSRDAELRVLAAGVGVATAIAGMLALARLREDMVGSILGALTAAAFTIGTTQLIQPTSSWRVLFPAAIYAALLFGFLAFRGGFRQRGQQRTR